MAKEYSAEASRVYDAPRSLVWALVSDTNRSDRALGLAPATYRWQPDETGKMIRVASARELGVQVAWIEPPYQWVEGRSIEGRRDFVQGPAIEGSFRAQLEDADGGRTLLHVRAAFRAKGAIAWILGPFQRLKWRRALARYLDALEQILGGWREHHVAGDDEPAATRARRLLYDTSAPIAVGARTLPDAAAFEQRAARLREAELEEAIVDQLLLHLRERPDDEVSQMRPFELARQWSLDRREVLRVFLHATLAGLLDLRWQINCPVCRVGARVVPRLAEIEETSHCQACQIHYDTDFGQHVEAVFPCNEAVRAVTPALYCASSPAFLPHVFAQIHVPAGGSVERAADVPVGPLHVRMLGRRGGVDVDPPRGSVSLRIAVADGALDVEAVPTADGPASISIGNGTDAPAIVLVERAGWTADAVLGSVVGSFPEFVDLFAADAPARGVELRVGHLALLFSDLVGSTALYQRVGDARAFAIVEDHFRGCAMVVDEAGGAIIKTMGDAVMASFPSLRDAVRAARGMIAAQEGATREHGLGVKIGVHAGPCLAVRANDRLDYFGTTVNLAARLQAQAASGELVLTRESADDPAIEPLIAGFESRRFRAALKGIETEQELVAFDCRRETAAEAAAAQA